MPSALTSLKTHPRVEIVDDERAIGNGVIVTLKQGWTFDPASDNRVSGEDTPSGAQAAAVADLVLERLPAESAS